jgi:hypothetical protein
VESVGDWPEFRFGRHRMVVPPTVLAQVETEFQLGTLRGYESKDWARVEERWKAIDAELYEVLDRDDPTKGIKREEVEIEGVQVLANYEIGYGSPSCSIAFVKKVGAGGICARDYFPEFGWEESLDAIRLVLADLETLPSTKQRQNPWYTQFFELEAPPDLGQNTHVLLSDERGRVLGLEMAPVRGREALDMSGAAFVRFSMLNARSEGFGKKANAMRTMTSRKVTGITATEFVWTTDAGDGGRLNFVWTHRGTAFDVSRPYLQIFYSGDLAHATARELRREWNSMLGSLDLVPQADLEFVY